MRVGLYLQKYVSGLQLSGERGQLEKSPCEDELCQWAAGCFATEQYCSIKRVKAERVSA